MSHDDGWKNPDSFFIQANNYAIIHHKQTWINLGQVFNSRSLQAVLISKIVQFKL
jgi:hypothetical protein